MATDCKLNHRKGKSQSKGKGKGTPLDREQSRQVRGSVPPLWQERSHMDRLSEATSRGERQGRSICRDRWNPIDGNGSGRGRRGRDQRGVLARRRRWQRHLRGMGHQHGRQRCASSSSRLTALVKSTPARGASPKVATTWASRTCS